MTVQRFSSQVYADRLARAAAVATIGGAIEAARQLGDAPGRLLTETARAAFMRGMRVCALIGAVGSLAMAAFVIATLRRPRQEPERSDAAAAA